MPGPYDELEKKAENFERQSKLEFNKKNFIAAIALLEEAKEIYLELGFQGKIGMINQYIGRIKNLITIASQDLDERVKSEQNFQKRVEEAISEKIIYEEKKLASLKTPSPEIKRKLEKVKLLLEKAEREEKLGKISRVIGRYEYVLELYRSIPSDMINVNNEIMEIEQKLSKLRSQ